jgi:hypothetical protein
MFAVIASSVASLSSKPPFTVRRAGGAILAYIAAYTASASSTAPLTSSARRSGIVPALDSAAEGAGIEEELDRTKTAYSLTEKEQLLLLYIEYVGNKYGVDLN